MDDGLRDFGEMPGYEFDQPRASGQPRAGAGGGERRRPTWPRQQSAGQPPHWRPPGQWRPGTAGPGPGRAAEPGRRALLARDTLAAMRARNWLVSLAVPLLAAIAVGVAGVVVLGANNGSDADAPSAMAAGFPPARSAAADFGGDGPAVEVSAIAAAGATEVAAGSANRGGGLWASADGGSTWRRAALTPPAAGRDGAGQFAGVAHGPSGWLAVGGASAGARGGPRPAGGGSPGSPTPCP